MGMGLNFALLKDNWYGDPICILFFLKHIIIVHEIKICIHIEETIRVSANFVFVTRVKTLKLCTSFGFN